MTYKFEVTIEGPAHKREHITNQISTEISEIGSLSCISVISLDPVEAEAEAEVVTIVEETEPIV